MLELILWILKHAWNKARCGFDKLVRARSYSFETSSYVPDGFVISLRNPDPMDFETIELIKLLSL